MAALIAHATFDQTFAADPIKVGFSMALTGAIAGNGKAALLATQMWADDQNSKGGLLGRPVELIYYDDQSNPSLVPGIYTKLFDIDKVDLVISGYGTNIIGPAMPACAPRPIRFVQNVLIDVTSYLLTPKGTDVPIGGRN